MNDQYLLQLPEHGARDPSRERDQCQIQILKSAIRNPQSAICNLQSAIANPQSAICRRF